MATATTATSRKAAPASAVLTMRRKVARERLDIEIKAAPLYAEMAKLDAELKRVATETGESFKEDFGADGYVSASGAVAAEFKGTVPQIVTEAYLKLKASERKDLERRGIVQMVDQHGRASNGKVTVKVL